MVWGNARAEFIPVWSILLFCIELGGDDYIPEIISRLICGYYRYRCQETLWLKSWRRAFWEPHWSSTESYWIYDSRGINKPISAGCISQDRSILVPTLPGNADGHRNDNDALSVALEEVTAGCEVRSLVAHRSEVLHKVHFIGRWVLKPICSNTCRARHSSLQRPAHVR